MLSPIIQDQYFTMKIHMAKERTILEVNESTAVKLDVSHGDPGRDAGGITISQEDLIVMNLI